MHIYSIIATLVLALDCAIWNCCYLKILQQLFIKRQTSGTSNDNKWHNN